jgi:hypothetical protein
MKLSPNAQKLRLYLGGFARAYNLEPSELAAVYFALAFDNCASALGDELTAESWGELAMAAWRKLTSS